MIDIPTAQMLANYNAWADETLFTALASLPASDIYRQTTTLFGSIIGTLNHNYQVDLIWQAHLLGKRHTFATRRDILLPKFEDLVQAQRVVDDWLIEWTTHQTPASLSDSVAFRFVSGQRDAKMQKGQHVTSCCQPQNLSSRVGKPDVFQLWSEAARNGSLGLPV
jgi:uncharacterized damage-inducible protein DinB